MRVRPGLELAALSDVGCQRENNEDRYSYWEPTSDQDFARQGRLLTIADGMGGHEGGQEASRLAIETVEKYYAGSVNCEPNSCLSLAVREAHLQIRQSAAENPVFHSMGTTCTTVLILNANLYWAHIGDSRLYLVRRGSISRLTHDHSYVGKMVEEGVITPEQAEIHPQRHILTAALGAGDEVIPEAPTEPFPSEAGDTLILCTDGLWGIVTAAEIENAVVELPPEKACRALVDLARKRGGPDNITVQIARLL